MSQLPFNYPGIPQPTDPNKIGQVGIDPSLVPEGHTQQEAMDWLASNPGDTHRLAAGLGPPKSAGLDLSNFQMPEITAPQPSAFQTKLEGYLDKVLGSGGMFDQSLVNQRKESAKDALDMARTGRVGNLRSSLASRGLLSLPGAKSGAEVGALGRLDADLGATYGSAIRDIFANEQENASNRFMNALGLGTQFEDSKGRQSIAQQQLGLDRMLGIGRLDLDKMLGTGNLALGQGKLASEHSLGQGRLDLDSEIASKASQQDQAGNLSRIIDDIINASRGSNEGYY